VTALESGGPEETRAFGERLGRVVEAGDVVLLSGELGAGKTLFVQGMAAGLGYAGPVSSKSFVILGEYAGREKLYHADLYRLEDPQQVAELALDEITADGVLAVEWPERAGYLLADQHLLVRFEVTGEQTRRLHLEPHGEQAERLARALQAAD
jgi:tRNA threonylcarbamoyladenosine biosynthesis protein TsaE